MQKWLGKSYDLASEFCIWQVKNCSLSNSLVYELGKIKKVGPLSNLHQLDPGKKCVRLFVWMAGNKCVRPMFFCWSNQFDQISCPSQNQQMIARQKSLGHAQMNSGRKFSAMFCRGIGESPLSTSPRWSTHARVLLLLGPRKDQVLSTGWFFDTSSRWIAQNRSQAWHEPPTRTPGGLRASNRHRTV